MYVRIEKERLLRHKSLHVLIAQLTSLQTQLAVASIS